jgi:hypothetical protein
MGAVNSSSFSAEVIDDSEMTGALPGKVLRGPGYALSYVP